MDNQTSQFANPEAGSLSSGRFEIPPEVEYAAMKTPQTFVSDVTKEKVASARAAFKLGFHFYDRELETPARVAIDKFSFVVLEVFSGVAGYRETQPGQPGISYFSNLVKNSKFEQLAIWEKGIKRPIAKGFYKGKRNENDFAKLTKFPPTQENDLINGQPGNFVKVPDGAGFHQYFFVWWIEGQRLLNLKLTTMVSREIKESISRAEARSGRRVKPDNVKLFSLAESTAFWGFEVTAFRRATKDGMDYANQGEMFLVPKFECGVVTASGNGSNAELHANCFGLQTQIRADYANEVERRKQFGVEDAAAETTGQPNQQGALGYESIAANPPQHGDHNFPVDYRESTNHNQGRTIQDAPPPAPDDDLPF